MEDIKVAHDFISSYKGHYEELLGIVRRVCDEWEKKLGPSVIDDIYTRADSMKSPDAILKEPQKIVNKLRKNGSKVTRAEICSLTDITGLTVVFSYSDFMDRYIPEICRSLNEQGVTTSAPDKKQKRGYFATHVDASRTVGGIRIFCEIQFKTMLHDSWSAKMHDLTYKPSGIVDERLSTLMASIAHTIENLELQSTVIRNMVKDGWNVEDRTRRSARHQLFTQMLEYHSHLWNEKAPAAVIALRERIEASRNEIETSSINEDPIKAITAEISSLGERDLRFAWVLAGRLASLRPTPDLVPQFAMLAKDWLLTASELIQSEYSDNLGKEIGAVPVMFYVCGDLDAAIEVSTEILEEKKFSKLRDIAKATLKFNRATFLTEREYHLPTSDKTYRAKIRNDIEVALKELEASGQDDTKASILDTQGLMKIAFGETQEEVRDGIKDCILAVTYAVAEEREVSESYSDLNMRLGWRRFFELESRDALP